VRHRWRCWLGVALDDDEAPQRRPVLPGHLLPHRLTAAIAEGDAAVGLGLGEEDAPAVVGHADVVEVGPALLAHRRGGPQEHVVVLVLDRAELAPPVEVAGQPGLEGALQAPVAGQADVVGYAGGEVDRRHQTLRGS
jgi:hypothetical protein